MSQIEGKISNEFRERTLFMNGLLIPNAVWWREISVKFKFIPVSLNLVSLKILKYFTENINNLTLQRNKYTSMNRTNAVYFLEISFLTKYSCF